MFCSNKKSICQALLVFLILISGNTFSQSKIIDSLELQIRQYPKKDSVMVELINSLVFELYDVDTDRADKLIEKSITLADSLHYNIGKVNAIYYKGQVEYVRSNYSDAIVYFKQALKANQLIGIKRNVSYSLNGIGMCYYEQGKYPKAIEYYTKSMLIDKEENDLAGVSACLNNIANVYADQGEHDEAIKFYIKAQRIKEKLNDKYGIARSYSNIGIIYSEQSNYPKALENYNMALAIHEEGTDSFFNTEVLNNIGRIYLVQSKFDDALSYFNRALENFEKLNSKKSVAFSYRNIGSVYTQQKKYKRALEYLHKSLKIEKSINKNSGVVSTLNSIADVQLELGNYDTAFAYYKESLDLSSKMSNLLEMSLSHLGIAKIYQFQNQLNKALEHVLKSQEIAIKLKLLDRQRDNYELLSKIYQSKLKYEDAFKNYRHYKALSDSIFDKESIQKLTQLEYEYKYEKQLDSANRRELKLIEKVKVTSKDLEITQRNYLWAIILFLVAVVVLGTIVFTLKLRDVQSKNQRIVVEQKLLRSQMTPHFIFNSLSVLQGMILNKEEKKSIFYLSRFSKLLRIILENSRDTLVPLMKELAAIENYLVLQNLGALTPYKYELKVDENIDQDRYNIPPMIIQPFVENAIEHAFVNQKENKEISIFVRLEKKQLVCSILDNGIGIDSIQKKINENKTSLATTITSERLKMLSKDFKVAGSVNIEDRKKYNKQGTLVTLILPYKYD